MLNHSLIRRQSGAALVVALIILLILTLLGVSAMNTTSLQEKMAANTQELSRALQAADSGTTTAFRDIDTTNLTAVQPGGTPALPLFDNLGIATGDNAGARSLARFITVGEPPVNSGYPVGSGFQAYYFDIQSTGHNLAAGTGPATAAIAGRTASTVILSSGMYQIGNKP